MHKMHLVEKYYNLIKSGKKTIELRLFDEKRKTIKIDDLIEFSSSSDPNDTLTTKVTRLYLADNFSELCSVVDIRKTGFSNSNELQKTLEQFYPRPMQNQFGVIGIEIQKI